MAEATRRLGHDARTDDARSAAAQHARWIVERVSGYGRAELSAHGDDPVTVRAIGYFDQLLARAAEGEPIQYVLGRWPFRELDLYIDREVLIPRPETEVVAGVAIELARARASALSRTVTAVDLGTGSGAIALSLASEVSDVEVWATDLSSSALAVARANLVGLGGRAATRTRLLEGSWFDPLPRELQHRVDVLVSNPPYVAEGEVLPDAVLGWEPHLALFAGPRGTEAIEHIMAQAPSWLAPGGCVVLELAPWQASAMAALAAAVGFAPVEVRADLSGLDRVLVATYEG